ncbi:MAG: MBL fold metallo-hydrolase, partial [Methanomassiliicoccales archaeon]|nr:MBL fold metallo-hydrolase [Methanomassiliicoccales archaeon]
DAILVQTPDGKNVLVDCGYHDYADDVIGFLKSLGIEELDAFIATHPDPDHIGSVPELFEEFQVRSVYHSGFVKDTYTYDAFIEAIEGEGCPVYDDLDFGPGDLLPLSANMTFKVLGVDAHSEDSNDASIVLKLSFGDVDIILEGDASWRTEGEMVDLFGDELDVEVLKVSHHGSSSASSYDWLDATSPEVAVVCIGPNEWDLPDQDIMDRLHDHCGQVLVTDEEGGVLLTSDGHGFSIGPLEP